MAVRFEFELSDRDAENLLGFLHAAYTRELVAASSALSRDQAGEAAWYNRSADYIAQLKKIVAEGSSRVESQL